MNNQIKAAYLDHMGDDLSVVNSARVSFAKESEWEWEEFGVKGFANESYQRLSDRDAKLIKYLAKHKHFSPFGHAFASFHVKAPISSSDGMRSVVGMLMMNLSSIHLMYGVVELRMLSKGVLVRLTLTTTHST